MITQELETQIVQLDRATKGRVLQRLALDLTHAWPGIEKNPGVQGGDACVVRTRIPVWTLEAYRRLGWEDDQLLEQFPSLRLADLIYAQLYVEANTEEIEAALQAQAAA